MAQQSNNTVKNAANSTASNHDGFAAQILGMINLLWTSPERNKIIQLIFALIGVIAGTAYAQLQLNAWNKPFYNALANKNLTVFIQQLGVFALLASILLVLNVLQMRLNQTSKVVLRESLVDDLISDWLAPRRAFLLSYAGEIGANPDQRIHEDAKHLTELTTDLSIGLLQSTLLLSSFIGVLWSLSGHDVLELGGHVLFTQPPGYMVWYALLYAGVASYISWRVGRPLIDLNAERYAHEAEMRFALVHVNEEIDGVTLNGGEGDEQGRITTIFETVLEVSRRIVKAVTRLTWVTAGYGWFTIVAPILVAAPAYFQGSMSFGELMVVVGAFNQVQQSLRWFVDNFANIADWRATMLRVASFRSTMLKMDVLAQNENLIEFEDSSDASIKIDNLQIATATGSLKLSQPLIEMKPGERILITGENGEEKSLAFRVFGGLWPWGSGKITRPPSDAIMFLPMRPYIPPGTLRAAISYPHSHDVYDAPTIDKAFHDVGLDHLRPFIDTTDRWDRRLNYSEKQCLMFVRILLHRPKWVVSDGALVALIESNALIKSICEKELSDIGVIGVRDGDDKNLFYTQKFHLTLDHEGPSFDLAAACGSGQTDRQTSTSIST